MILFDSTTVWSRQVSGSKLLQSLPQDILVLWGMYAQGVSSHESYESFQIYQPPQRFSDHNISPKTVNYAENSEHVD